jgi:hypothetical protein
MNTAAAALINKAERECTMNRRSLEPGGADLRLRSTDSAGRVTGAVIPWTMRPHTAPSASNSAGDSAFQIEASCSISALCEGSAAIQRFTDADSAASHSPLK